MARAANNSSEPMPPAHQLRNPHPGAGPLVWVAIIGVTCLLLLVMQKLLWLTVPFLLGLILYYLLYPAMCWLTYRGAARGEAAAGVMLAFLLAMGMLAVLLFPWAAQHATDVQTLVERYLDGGLAFLRRTLQAMELRWEVLARADLAERAGGRLGSLTDHLEQYLEPAIAGILAWAPSLLLAPFVAFFFLRDGGRFQRMLAAAVPNAFFERTLYLTHEVDRTARAYFVGLMKLTVLDTATLAIGLWLIGMPSPLVLGILCAVLAWVPYVGSIVGGLIVVLVAATDFPATPAMAYAAVALFLLVRMLDDFVYMPLTIGRSLHIHPLVTVTMIFVGGAVAGVSGLMLVLPLLGVVMVVGETVGRIVTAPRLLARYRHERALRRRTASADLTL